MPTHDSEHEVKYLNENRESVSVSRDGKLLPEVLEVLSLIAQHDLTLATGHVTPKEALMILREAKNRGVQHMIVTHPLLGPPAKGRREGGFSKSDLNLMFKENPARLIKLPVV